jgi:hypothetical protein
MDLKKASTLIEGFEDCTLPKEQWTHVAHFIMALWYCLKLPLPQAVPTIRNGIKRYNLSVGGQNTDVAGYHETITLFYIKTIAGYLVTKGITVLTDEEIAAFLKQPFLAKDYMLRWYSKELLMSSEARCGWVEPDATIAPMALSTSKHPA